MKALSDDDLRMNEQAAGIAASVLGEAVEAATRCEQATQDMMAGAAGVGAINRGLMRGMKKVGKVASVGRMAEGLETGGLPGSFVLAVTKDKIHAIEDNNDGTNLAAGKALKSWDRAGLNAYLSPAQVNRVSGVPDDRQMLVIRLPIEGGHNRYLKAAANNTAGMGMPHKFMVAKDAASQGVIDAIVSADAGPNIMIGGQSIQGMMGQAVGNVAAADPAAQLTQLADLHDRGVLTDDEFAAQKARVLGQA